MKVKTLLARLRQCNPDAVVVLSIDEEGNGYNEIAAVMEGYNFEDGDIEESAEASATSKECVILYP